MTLRTRLFLALLAIALAPTLVFAWFTLVQLHTATSRWYQSGVERALVSAIETNRATLDRLEATALERADAWAGTLPDLAADPAQREAMRTRLREAGLDFVQVYERDTTWHAVATVVPAGVSTVEGLDLGGEIADAMAGDRLIRSGSGELAAVAPVSDGVVLVVGFHLIPGFWEKIDGLREARALYARVGVLVDVQRQRVWITIAVLLIAIGAGAAMLAGALADGMTVSLKRLATALEGVRDTGPREPLPVDGPAELAAISTAFNAMTARLAEARQALARAEREAAWRDVARRLAHEIKNPLTPMTLSLHRLQRRAALVPEHERAAVLDSLGAMLQEIDHLAQLAETFSQYARMPEPRHDRLDLSELARAAAALHEPQDVRLSVACELPLPVHGDRLLLSRAVHNLLVNAIEASPPGSTVELVSGSNGSQAWVEVRDRGSGLDPRFAARVFEPYVSTKNRGSGLGLSLVHDIMLQHKGEVTLVDREGGGAVARLSLPLA
jgi:nitrogen fixation/metabolism regulation signal transduction histidine kinase